MWCWLDVGVSDKVLACTFGEQSPWSPIVSEVSSLIFPVSQEHWAPGHSKVIWGHALRFIPVEGPVSALQLGGVD